MGGEGWGAGMGIESMRGMVPQAFFRNAGCREHQRWKCPMLNVENSLSVQALFLLLLHTIYLFSVVALETKYFLHESAFYPDKSSESAERNRIFFNPRSRVVKGLVQAPNQRMPIISAPRTLVHPMSHF